MIILLIIFYIVLSILFILELFGLSYVGTYSEVLNLYDFTFSLYFFNEGRGNFSVEIQVPIEIEQLSR